MVGENFQIFLSLKWSSTCGIIGENTGFPTIFVNVGGAKVVQKGVISPKCVIKRCQRCFEQSGKFWVQNILCVTHQIHCSDRGGMLLFKGDMGGKYRDVAM